MPGIVPHPFSDFDALYDRGMDRTGMKDVVRRRLRFYNLIQAFNLTRRLKGETVEIGCYRGLSSFLICSTIREWDAEFRGKGHHIIDSFEGLSVPVPEDRLSKRVAGKFSDTSMDLVRSTLREFPDVTLTKGWVPDVLAEIPQRAYRFVHVDVDLHVPTRACLEFFFQQLVPGGVLVVDDFGPWPEGGRYPGCWKAVIDFADSNGIGFAALNTGNAILIKP